MERAFSGIAPKMPKFRRQWEDRQLLYVAASSSTGGNERTRNLFQLQQVSPQWNPVHHYHFARRETPGREEQYEGGGGGME